MIDPYRATPRNRHRDLHWLMEGVPLEDHGAKERADEDTDDEIAYGMINHVSCRLPTVSNSSVG